jgi:hypothetical protein
MIYYPPVLRIIMDDQCFWHKWAFTWMVNIVSKLYMKILTQIFRHGLLVVLLVVWPVEELVMLSNIVKTTLNQKWPEHENVLPLRVKCWIFSENMKIWQHLEAKRFHVLVISDSKLFLQCGRACHALQLCKNNFESERTRTWKSFSSKSKMLIIFWKYENMPTLRGKTF